MIAEKILRRQLKKAKIVDLSKITPEQMEKFLALVRENYETYEKERKIMERSIDLSSKEMQALNENLAQKVEEVSELNRTLSRRVEEEVEKNRRKDRQMFQQTRLAQMGEMLSMIAHQWRQPLSAISSVAISMQMKIQLKRFVLADKRQQKEFEDYFLEKIEAIGNYVQYLSHTIDDFRNFFRPNKAKERTTLELLLQKAIDMLHGSYRKNSIAVYQKIENSCEIVTYPNEILQVLLNILKNALDNFRERNIEHPRVEVRLVKRGNTAMLEIEDNGGGIPKMYLSKIFDPYFSTKDEKNGSGLGLYMSKTIVEEHCGGKLEAQNTKEGALFRIILPLSRRET
ncbi:MAG: hypothetical protein B6D59_01360 [Campylobacteraceae bacterium 4484_4]|nr:MAG: hypothetical protein B6D59_01360 [Campylobacteraceae bacterium 4484_4]